MSVWILDAEHFFYAVLGWGLVFIRRRRDEGNQSEVDEELVSAPSSRRI